MTQDEIIKMAKETLLASWHKDLKKWQIDQGVEAFAKLVAAKEREACAKVCEQISDPFGYANLTAEVCAQAIRARGEA